MYGYCVAQFVLLKTNSLWNMFHETVFVAWNILRKTVFVGLNLLHKTWNILHETGFVVWNKLHEINFVAWNMLHDDCCMKMLHSVRGPLFSQSHY